MLGTVYQKSCNKTLDGQKESTEIFLETVKENTIYDFAAQIPSLKDQTQEDIDT